MYDKPIRLIRDELQKYNIILDEKNAGKLQIYSQQLIEWNQKINLTAIIDPSDIAIKHFLDSIVVLDAYNFKKNAKVIDVGTGAGFPGIPIKIIRDDIDLTLLDSLNKRLMFLSDLTAVIDVEAKLVHMRAECGGRIPEYREMFDVSVSRAVASLNTLVEYCLPYVKIGGAFIAMKGPNVDEEIKNSREAIEKLGGKIKEVKKYELVGDNTRTIVIIEKLKPTPKEYPRHGSKISKKPL